MLNPSYYVTETDVIFENPDGNVEIIPIEEFDFGDGSLVTDFLGMVYETIHGS